MLGRGEDSCMGDKGSAGPGHQAALGKVVTPLPRVQHSVVEGRRGHKGTDPLVPCGLDQLGEGDAHVL